MDLIDFSQVVAHPDDEAWGGAMFFRTPLIFGTKIGTQKSGSPKGDVLLAHSLATASCRCDHQRLVLVYWQL